jgi:hypothetical protein
MKVTFHLDIVVAGRPYKAINVLTEQMSFCPVPRMPITIEDLPLETTVSRVAFRMRRREPYLVVTLSEMMVATTAEADRVATTFINAGWQPAKISAVG